MINQYYNRNSGKECHKPIKKLMTLITLLRGVVRPHLSVKVMRGYFGRADLERQDAIGFDRKHMVEVLQGAFNQQELFANEEEAIFFEQVGSDDGVGDAGLILQAEKHESVGGAGALAGDDAAGNAHAAAIFDVLQVAGAQHTTQLEAPVSHGVAAHSQAGAAEIGYQAFFVVHARQRRSGIVFGNSLQQRSGGARGTLHLPEGIATVEVGSGEWPGSNFKFLVSNFPADCVSTGLLTATAPVAETTGFAAG